MFEDFWGNAHVTRALEQMAAIDRLPQTGYKGTYLKQKLRDKLTEHKQYIEENGQDMPEIRNWKWET